ncbi:MAG: hypothetical protein FWC91_06305 [Defluviitaleaceae bacterium]|nr:hypothetical protein [Defluviitaleaceae bacterium]
MPKLDTLGIIKDYSSRYNNWYVLIESDRDDLQETADCGYYIFTVKYNIAHTELKLKLPASELADIGYDSWCEDWKHVEINLKGYEIEWLEGEEIFFGHRYYDKNNPSS